MAPGSPATLSPWSVWFCVVVVGAYPADPLTVARGRGSVWCWGSVPCSHPRSLGHQAGGDPLERGALHTLAPLIPPTRLPSLLSG